MYSLYGGEIRCFLGNTDLTQYTVESMDKEGWGYKVLYYNKRDELAFEYIDKIIENSIDGKDEVDSAHINPRLNVYINPVEEEIREPTPKMRIEVGSWEELQKLVDIIQETYKEEG